MRIIAPVMAKIIRGSVCGGLMIAMFGLSSITEAAPLIGSVKMADHQFGSDAGLMSLVDTRDHDADASADHSTAEKSTPKKMDKSMKQVPAAKDQSNQKHGKNEQPGTKASKSAQSDEQLSIEEADKKLDRPDDRRQGKNLERKP